MTPGEKSADGVVIGEENGGYYSISCPFMQEALARLRGQRLLTSAMLRGMMGLTS